jgi:hypothetical protein
MANATLEWVPAFDPCPCESGKLHGQCCAQDPKTRYLLATVMPGGRTYFLQLSQITGRFVRKRAPPFAEWMLRSAALSVQAALKPDAAEHEALGALLGVGTALEVAVNRLLEPLMKPAEWLSFEGKSPRQKWANLYQKLGIKPGFDDGREPFKSFLDLVALRNSLVHFKHGKNVQVGEMPVPISWALGDDGGEVTFEFPKELPAVPDSAIYDELNPARARRFGEALIAMLDPVLAQHQSDEWDVVDKMKAELGHMRRALATGQDQKKA